MRGPRTCRVAVGVGGALGCVFGDHHWEVLNQWGRWPVTVCGALFLAAGFAWSALAGRLFAWSALAGRLFPWFGLAGRLFARRRRAWVPIYLLLVLTAFGVTAGRAASARFGVERGVVTRLAGSGAWVTVRGRVASEVKVASGSHRFTLRLSEVRTGLDSQRTEERLTAAITRGALEDDGGEALDTGIEIEAEGVISGLDPEYRERALRSRSLGVLKVRAYRITGAAPRWLGATTAVRDFFRRGAEASLGAEQSGLLLGLMYGDTRGLSQDGEAAFRRAGLSHLTAVSGQNFVLVMGAIAALLRLIPPLWHRRRLRTAILVSAALWFMGLTRWEPSVLRAGAMAIVLLLALSAGIRPSFAELVSVAGLVALIGDPMLVFSVGFQLSVAATVAIAYWAVPLSGCVAKFARIPKAIALPTAVALSAEMGVAPLIAAHFGTVQVLSVPANLLAVPVAGFVSVWGYVASAVSAVAPRLGGLVHLGTRLPLWWIRGVADTVGGLRIAEAEIGRPDWAVVALAYLLMAVTVRALTARSAIDRDLPGKGA
ncbi:MAG: hypothetical protein DCC49_07395 [Acidobacteria bacterium]|nr:MAG: hypothetical protein DCC49_07395 [Acidobacteriota bacterium]